MYATKPGMIATDSEITPKGQVEAQSISQQQLKHQTVLSLGRQSSSSIYSLTLDEFQHTLCESGKSFGSMNMDEFLNSIWTAEENQAQAHAQADTGSTHALQFPLGEGNGKTRDMGLSKQPSLQGQGCLSIPEPLSRKTVDEVWSEIDKDQQHGNDGHGHIHNPTGNQGQLTFGEMTLEDFLIRAGIVRANNFAPVTVPQQPIYGMYVNSNRNTMGPNFVARSVMAIGGGPAGGVNVATCQAAVLQQLSAVSYGGTVGNGTGGYGRVQGLGMRSPTKPGSSDGLCTNQAESGNLYGLDMDGMRGGRKRIIDGPVEVVVERRQRRMIKNRESAARSRARKKAYTVELEAELNQLKEENADLTQALAELERKRKQQYFKEEKPKAQIQSKAQRVKEKLRVLRRSSSCCY